MLLLIEFKQSRKNHIKYVHVINQTYIVCASLGANYQLIHQINATIN